ncbi:MAG: agmatine deiminase family protein [Aureliella sp.]
MNKWVMPEEGDPHERTWMSMGASQRVWGRKLIGEVRRNLATVARTIAQFEPVTVCVRPNEAQLVKESFVTSSNVDFLECDLNDIWIRDYGAVYVVNEAGEKAAVNFNFNGWGEKQDFEFDRRVAKRMARASEVALIDSKLCLEGGGVEVDGEGTAIITESCVINKNRNPRWSKRDCEAELLSVLGIEKVIWLPGVRGADITDGHTDFYARFASPGVVVVHYDPDTSSRENRLTRRQIEILKGATDAQGNRLHVVTLEAPSVVREQFETPDFCAGYVNFYLCNNAVIAPEFGDARKDAIAKEKLQDCFPKREVVMVNIDGIAAGGGGIHCATQQEPKL